MIEIIEQRSNGKRSNAAGDCGVAAEARVGCRRGGKCKWFNVAKGWGFVTPFDGGPDVFVHQSVIQMTGFRSLGDDEEVEFECKRSGKGYEATMVTGPEGADCRGSHRRPMSKKRFKKVRCYNCGEFANHMAAKCTLGPQPKRCHHCKSSEHLIADCPSRDEKKRGGGKNVKEGDTDTERDSGTERDGELSSPRGPEDPPDGPSPPLLDPDRRTTSRVAARLQADSAANSSSGESDRL